jgi:hypothetical protein
MADNKNPKGAGRKALPPERKKVAKPVYLKQSEIDALETKYSSLTIAIRMLLINDTQANNEALETIKQIKELTKNY